MQRTSAAVSAEERIIMTKKSIEAEPYALEFDPHSTLLLIIDTPRDFVMPSGSARRSATT